MNTIHQYISFLFCPAHKEKQYNKALNTEADCIIFDLEDAVPLASKALARETFCKWFTATPQYQNRTALRVNPLNTKEGLLDALALQELETLPAFIFIPKTESAVTIQYYNDLLQNKTTKFIALVETAIGIQNSFQIVTQSPNLVAMMMGSADLSSDLLCNNDRTSLQYANSRLINACATKGIGCIDSPFFDLDNTTKLKQDTLVGLQLGFTARSVIHPTHIKTIHTVYTPTMEAVKDAEQIITIAQQGVGILNGKMIDRAMIKKAKRILERIK